MTLEQAVESIAPRLVKYCRARIGRMGLAEEVAQDSLAALVQRWRHHGKPECPEAFVFAIARRLAWRATVRARLFVPLEQLLDRRDRLPSAEALAIGTQEWDAMRRALKRLRRTDREALLLVAVAGVERSVAAKSLGISQTALNMRTMRARRRLAVLLEKEHGVPRQTRR